MLDEIEYILTDELIFAKFRNFDQNSHLFKMEKLEYINKMTDYILDNYLQKKVDKSMIFHKFIINVLTPIFSKDYSYIFKNKLLCHLVRNDSTYCAFIRGICGDKIELINNSKKNIAEMMENGNIDMDYFYNFINATIDDASIFNCNKDAHELTMDYLVYFNLAKLIILKYPKYLDAAIKIICYQEARKSEILVKVNIENLGDKNGGNHSVCRGVHNISINSNLIENYSGRKKELAKILSIAYHEAQHALQYNLYYNSKIENYKILLWAKEELARIAIGIRYYDENYRSYIYESDANYVGWKNTKKYFNDFLNDYSLDDFFLNHMKVYKEKRKSSYHKDISNIIGVGEVEHRAADLLNAIALNYVKKNPYILKEFPILSVEFRSDGTPKSILEKLSDREKSKLSILDSRKETYSHYMNRLITKEELLLKEQEYESLEFDLNRLYDFVLSEFVDSHIDHLIEDGMKIIMIREDVSGILINIIEKIRDNFYNEDLDSKIYEITNFIKLADDYIVEKKNELDKFYYLKLISYGEWVEKVNSLASKHFYIKSKLAIIKEDDFSERYNQRNKNLF